MVAVKGEVTITPPSCISIGRSPGQLFFFFFWLFAFSRAASTAYGGSQARGLIRAVATGLHTPQLQQCGIQAASATISQLKATPDP